jgi:hypothetical protein
VFPGTAPGTWYAHASVGTLHVRPILDMRRNGAPRCAPSRKKLRELVRKYKGAYSGEHGDGLCRGEWIEVAVRPEDQRGLSAIKRMLDPLGLLSPNRKVIDPPRMDDTRLLRFAPTATTPSPLVPALDWSGLERAEPIP